MQSIFSLVKHKRSRPINYFGGNLFASVGRQTVEKYGIRFCKGEKLCIYLIWGKGLMPYILFFLLSHTCPYIGVDYIGIFYCLIGELVTVMRQLDNLVFPAPMAIIWS